jgi:hypothetical protein
MKCSRACECKSAGRYWSYRTIALNTETFIGYVFGITPRPASRRR